jgi:hypothetical protein
LNFDYISVALAEQWPAEPVISETATLLYMKMRLALSGLTRQRRVQTMRSALIYVYFTQHLLEQMGCAESAILGIEKGPLCGVKPAILSLQEHFL